MRRWLLTAAMLAAACLGDSPPRSAAGPAPAAAPEAASPPSTPTPAAAAAPIHRRFLDWVDPGATAAALLRASDEIDLDALATAFALPPRALILLRDASDPLEDLDAVLPVDAPRAGSWLGPEALVFTPAVALGNVSVRRLLRPRLEFATALEAAGFKATTLQGLDARVPDGPYPWRVVFLAEDLVAFVPARDPGTGVDPLAAGRDLPPSDLERELDRAASEDPELLVELFVQGPTVHLDLPSDVGAVRWSLRRWEDRGIDGSVLLQPLEDPAGGLKALSARRLTGEAPAVGRAAARVVFTHEDPVLRGRAQLPAADVPRRGPP